MCTKNLDHVNEILDFFKKYDLPTIQWAMAKRYREARDCNKQINDWKANNLKNCFKSTIFVVIFFLVFIVIAAIDANGKTKTVTACSQFPQAHNLDQSERRLYE